VKENMGHEHIIEDEAFFVENMQGISGY